MNNEKREPAMFYFPCNYDGSYKIIVSLYRLLCVITAKVGTKYVLILNRYRLNNTEKRIFFLIRNRWSPYSSRCCGGKMIHNQASKAKNGQIQMCTLLLSCGISIQPLTDIRQEK